MSRTEASDADSEYVIRSPYRPLTRNARDALEEFNILRDVDAEDDMGRGNGVVVANLPPEDVLEKHELEIDRDPDVVFLPSKIDTTVEVYTDPEAVYDGATETSMDPIDAVEHALDNDWDIVSGDPDAVLN